MANPGDPREPAADERPFAWQTVYRAAIMEADPVRLIVKIGEAEIAMTARLVQQPGGEELEALKNALRTLRFLVDQRKTPKQT